MITKKDILAMVSHISRRSRRVPDRRLIHPMREWVIGLVLFTVVLIGGGYLSASQFSYFSSVDAQLEKSDVAVAAYDATGMEAVLLFFDERTLQFQQIRNGIIPPLAPQPVLEEVVASSSSSTEPVEIIAPGEELLPVLPPADEPPLAIEEEEEEGAESLELE
ncbi:MAG: hypothetical protein AAFO91_12135 [Bacteroidota bacterium]